LAESTWKFGVSRLQLFFPSSRATLNENSTRKMRYIEQRKPTSTAQQSCISINIDEVDRKAKAQRW
jgi:hypothetical protein